VAVYAANFAGAAVMALLVHWSGILELSGGAFGRTAVAIARAKAELGFAPAFFRGILCNALVCLAVWICLAAHDVAGKILAILIPISAFVALGFEHSVANMYLIPAGILAGADIPLRALATNLIPVTLGNIVGGSGGVAMVYWIVYCRDRRAQPATSLRRQAR
jgi:formate/nitrite transporter